MLQCLFKSIFAAIFLTFIRCLSIYILKFQKLFIYADLEWNKCFQPKLKLYIYIFTAHIHYWSFFLFLFHVGTFFALFLVFALKFMNNVLKTYTHCSLKYWIYFLISCQPTNQNGKQTAPNEILIKFHAKTKANKLFTSKTSNK